MRNASQHGWARLCTASGVIHRRLDGAAARERVVDTQRSDSASRRPPGRKRKHSPLVKVDTLPTRAGRRRGLPELSEIGLRTSIADAVRS